MTEAEAIRSVRKAAKRRVKARKEVQNAMDELRLACVMAQQEGVSISQIAREAGLSRQGVYDLLGERPSP